MPKRRNLRNCNICANCNTGSLAVRLLAVGGQGGAYVSWYSTASILFPGLTAYLAVSSVIPGTLRRRLWVVWFYGFSAHASFTSRLLSLSVGRQSVSVSATVTAVSEPSFSAVGPVFSVTAITKFQLRRHFRLRPKPEKNWFWSVSSQDIERKRLH